MDKLSCCPELRAAHRSSNLVDNTFEREGHFWLEVALLWWYRRTAHAPHRWTLYAPILEAGTEPMLSRRLQDVHAAANLLSRTILVFDDRERGQPGILFCCEPGYAKAANIIKQTTAKQMMAQDPTALWIHLTPGHFTALQRNTQ